jgi:hypothetical protein
MPGSTFCVTAEGDPALLQVHESLLESTEMLSKLPAGTPVVIGGELGWPFLFTGQVRGIAPPPSHGPVPMSTVPRRYMEIAVSKVLWGKFDKSMVRAWCNSMTCGGAQPNEEVILHCRATRLLASECSPPGGSLCREFA